MSRVAERRAGTGIPTACPPFHPPVLLRHPHLMTMVARLWPRQGLPRRIPTATRLFKVAPENHLLAYCHWQQKPTQQCTLVLVHGLEGCSESHYMLGLAAKVWQAGLNVVRLNQRNCGGSEHLATTLYHNGMSGDFKAVLEDLHLRDGLQAIWILGYSMGGNLALKMAGEVGGLQPALKGVLAVCPNIDPAACVAALERPENRFYQRYFLKRLKVKLRRKAELFPGKFDTRPLARIRTLRAFDSHYTAPDGGYQNVEEYYERSGARHVIENIQVPTLILTAQDDPFIPFDIFQTSALRNHPWIRLWAPRYGGHCGFFQRRTQGEDHYWAENRLLELIPQEPCGTSKRLRDQQSRW